MPSRAYSFARLFYENPFGIVFFVYNIRHKTDSQGLQAARVGFLE